MLAFELDLGEVYFLRLFFGTDGGRMGGIVVVLTVPIILDYDYDPLII